MLNRRSFTAAFASAALVGGTTASRAAKTSRNGLLSEEWFLDTPLDLPRDFEFVRESGKRLAVLFEQADCSYCEELHRVNFTDPEVLGIVRDKFAIIQIDFWGRQFVTDFDGEDLEEGDLARKWNITFTPTIVFLPETIRDGALSSGVDLQVASLPGYFRPFHFLSMFEYVLAKRYETQDFPRFLRDKIERLERQNRMPKVL